jgi:hypothetical protein
MGLMKTAIWIDCSDRRKLKSGAVQVGFFPWVEYQKVGQLWQLSIGYIYNLIGPTVYMIQNFAHWPNCWKLNWTAQQLEEIKFWSVGKSESPELPNTKTICNSLSFPMVHYPTWNG